MNFSGISRNGLAGKILRLPLNLVPKNMVIPIFQGTTRGYKWVVGSSTHGCWLGSYEYKKQLLISKLIRPNTVAYDIGAHVGFYTLIFSKLVGENGKVVAFEPFPENIAYLKQHLKVNHISNVEVCEVAVSEHSGKTFFRRGPNSSTGYVTEHPVAEDLEIHEVCMDELVLEGKLPIPDYIKIDIVRK